MQLVLKRIEQSKLSTEGRLEVDGVFQCFTLEPTYREVPGAPVKDWKVMGKTAIPIGTYPVSVTYFRKDKYYSPILEDVPGFSGIRIHIGNFPADTDGCILVGTKLGPDKVINSKVAFSDLMALFDKAKQRNEGVQISVENAWGPSSAISLSKPTPLARLVTMRTAKNQGEDIAGTP